MYLSVFIINGCVSIISKLHQSQTAFSTVNTSEFIILGGIFKFLLAGVLFIVFKRKEKLKFSDIHLKKASVIIVFSAFISGISSLFQLLGATNLPATVLYPFITGGTIIFSALFDIFLFKEKLSRKLIFGIIFCFAGSLMFL